MKRYIVLLIAVAAILSGCKKYEEGPLVSFRGKEKRITNNWEVESLLIDGVDSTKLYNDSCGCQMLFEIIDKPEAGYYKTHSLLLHECKLTRSLIGRLGGYWKLTDNKTKLSLDIGGCYPIVPNSLTIGFGPIKRYTESEWVIMRLTINELWLKTTYNNKEYYLKLKD